MGTILIADVWLANLVTSRTDAHESAAQLLAAQILTYNRRGHLLDLSGEPTRKAIVYAAKLRTIPHVMVRCSRCGVMATLPMWVRAAAWEQPEMDRRRDVVQQNPTLADPRFLETCPGDEIVADLVQITMD